MNLLRPNLISWRFTLTFSMNTLGTKTVVERGMISACRQFTQLDTAKSTMRLNIPAWTNIRLYIGTPRALQ